MCVSDLSNIHLSKFFKKYRLWDMIKRKFGSGYNAIDYVYPNRFRPWEINCMNNKWVGKEGLELSKEAVKWLVEEELRIPLEEIPNVISKRVFMKYGLDSMTQVLFGHSPFKCIDFVYPGRFNKEDFKSAYGGRVCMSNHGDKAYSLFEREIDDMLYDWGIDHVHFVRYPNSLSNCDIVVGGKEGYWIEVAGMDNPEYIIRLDEKIDMAKGNGLNLIVVRYNDSKKEIIKKLSPVIKEFGNGVTLNGY